MKVSHLTTSITVGVIGALVGYAFGAILALHRQDSIWSPQTPLVNKALDLYGRGKLSRSDLLRRYTPVAVYLPHMTCVAMKSRKPAAGGEDTMCFDKGEHRLLFTYGSGD